MRRCKKVSVFSKRTISAGSFICLRGKKAASLNGQQSDRYNTTSLAMMTNRHSRSQSSKFVQGESNWENEVQKCNLTRGKEDGDEIPVGADWTFRRIKKAGDSSGVEVCFKFFARVDNYGRSVEVAKLI